MISARHYGAGEPASTGAGVHHARWSNQWNLAQTRRGDVAHDIEDQLRRALARVCADLTATELDDRIIRDSVLVRVEVDGAGRRQ